MLRSNDSSRHPTSGTRRIPGKALAEREVERNGDGRPAMRPGAIEQATAVVSQQVCGVDHADMPLAEPVLSRLSQSPEGRIGGGLIGRVSCYQGSKVVRGEHRVGREMSVRERRLPRSRRADHEDERCSRYH